ncbi:hypothetical protein HA402_007041 [Bradysia odoriphaga]|nr:hypothetical protein HA402_007041 [Bradysia odoriphaga]
MGLSFAVKTGICENECEVERAALNIFEQNMRTQFTELLAEIEEIKLTSQDVCYARETFNDFVISKGTNPVTMQVPLERFQKFIRNYNKNGTIAVEKMRLKCFTLESNYADKKLELQQRMDMSSILRPVDFEQLKIDIRSLNTALEEKTATMLRLKSINGNRSLQLVDERRQLATLEDHLHRYKEKCKSYRRETEQMCGKILKIENDIKYWKNLVDELNDKIRCYAAPSFEDYFQLKIELRNMRKEEYRLQRKKNIALIKLKNLNHKLRVANVRTN